MKSLMLLALLATVPAFAEYRVGDKVLQKSGAFHVRADIQEVSGSQVKTTKSDGKFISESEVTDYNPAERYVPWDSSYLLNQFGLRNNRVEYRKGDKVLATDDEQDRFRNFVSKQMGDLKFIRTKILDLTADGYVLTDAYEGKYLPARNIKPLEE